MTANPTTPDPREALREVTTDMRDALVHSEKSGEPIKTDDVGEWLAILSTLAQPTPVRGDWPVIRTDTAGIQWVERSEAERRLTPPVRGGEDAGAKAAELRRRLIFGATKHGNTDEWMTIPRALRDEVAAFLAALATPAARQGGEAGTVIALAGLRQYRYEASVSKTQSVEIGIESLDCMIAALSARPAAGDGWQPIETAPKDNKRPLYLAQFNADTGELIELDWDAVWEAESESWEMPQVYYIWKSANGRVEEPTHWAYQDGPPPTIPPAREGVPELVEVGTAIDAQARVGFGWGMRRTIRWCVEPPPVGTKLFAAAPVGRVPEGRKRNLPDFWEADGRPDAEENGNG